jgi:hypothetical protein
MSTSGGVTRMIGAPLVERTSRSGFPHVSPHLYDFVAQSAGQRDSSFIGAFPNRQLPRPSTDRILAADGVHGDFDQRPPQPRRAFARDPAAPVPIRARVDARHQTRIAGKRRTARKAQPVADFRAQGEREDRPDADHRVERASDRIGLRARRHHRFGGRRFRLDRRQHVAQPGEGGGRIRRQLDLLESCQPGGTEHPSDWDIRSPAAEQQRPNHLRQPRP